MRGVADALDREVETLRRPVRALTWMMATNLAFTFIVASKVYGILGT